MANPSPRGVLIVGGGLAAVEALLALRALAGESVSIAMVSMSDRFVFRPAASLLPFGAGSPHAYDLRAIAEEAGAEFRRDQVRAVAGAQRRVRLASFATLEYDSLVLALGARAYSGVPGALVFRNQGDARHVRRVLRELRAEQVRRLVFAVPSGCTWPLPVYELALMTARYAERHRVPAEITIVTPASEPLDAFGPEASRVVRHLLAEHGVRFEGGVVPVSVRRDGSLELQFAGAIAADRVIAAPQLRGHRITGVPSTWWGFVPVDTEGRVEGMADVHAAGDMTTFPLKQGGLATQQADAIALKIARQAGAPAPDPLPDARILRAELHGAEQPIVLRAVVDDDGLLMAADPGHPAGALAETPFEGLPGSSASALATKVLGRYITPYLESHEPLLV